MKRALVLLAFLPAAACGQSGTEGAARPVCVCDQFVNQVPFRGHIVALDGKQASVKVEALLVDGDPRPSFLVGETLGGTWNGADPCDVGCLNLKVGDEVLAYHRSGDEASSGCPEYLACVSERSCKTQTTPELQDQCDEVCLAQTQQACKARTAQAKANGTLRMTAWSPSALVFASNAKATITVAPQDLQLMLAGSQACYDKFKGSASSSTTTQPLSGAAAASPPPGSTAGPACR